jgi:hypothetical protein
MENNTSTEVARQMRHMRWVADTLAMQTTTVTAIQSAGGREGTLLIAGAFIQKTWH